MWALSGGCHCNSGPLSVVAACFQGWEGAIFFPHGPRPARSRRRGPRGSSPARGAGAGGPPAGIGRRRPCAPAPAPGWRLLRRGDRGAGCGGSPDSPVPAWRAGGTVPPPGRYSITDRDGAAGAEPHGRTRPAAQPRQAWGRAAAGGSAGRRAERRGHAGRHRVGHWPRDGRRPLAHRAGLPERDGRHSRRSPAKNACRHGRLAGSGIHLPVPEDGRLPWPQRTGPNPATVPGRPGGGCCFLRSLLPSVARQR